MFAASHKFGEYIMEIFLLVLDRRSPTRFDIWFGLPWLDFCTGGSCRRRIIAQYRALVSHNWR